MSENKTSRTISVSTILSYSPCHTYTKRLIERFGADGEILFTAEIAGEQAQDWDWYWAAEKLLTWTEADAFYTAAREISAKHSPTSHPYRNMLREARREAEGIFSDTRDKLITEGASSWDAYEMANKAYTEHTAPAEAAYRAVYKLAEERINQEWASKFAELFLASSKELQPYEESYYSDSDYEEYEDDEPCNCGCND